MKTWIALSLLTACMAASAAADPVLLLKPAPGSEFANVGDFVVIQVHMRDLDKTLAAGFQGFLRFDSQRLAFVSGSYTSTPFGLAIISPIRADGEHIDIASGINPFIGQLPTSNDSLLASLTFQSLANGCVTSVVFRPHNPPSRITDPDGNDVPDVMLIGLAEDQPSPDFNESGTVDVLDLLYLLGNWGVCPMRGACAADLNCDGTVDVLDLLILLGAWGPYP
ncbi:MAG TPA: hypothetical protein PK098_01050 [Phycisphaerales bacterium]|nr:hypothetical protein [Phycisphaerales bacterium]